MDKKMTDRLKEEQAIPDEVMEKLIQNRKALLSGNIPQEKMVKKNHRKRFAVILAITAVACLIVITKTPISAAIENALGISRDSAVETVESQGIPTQLDLTSTQNGREIKLTKFVATKKKIAFDYQFKINDESLKDLLSKQIAANSLGQDINIGLFAEGSTEDIFGGVMIDSTFRVEGDTFYGSFVGNFVKEKIPENEKLTLHIYSLSWTDRDELAAAYAAALERNDGEPWGVDEALRYEGDWSFAIDYQPLPQTAVPQVNNVSNISDISAKSDALQTTVKFSVPVPEAVNLDVDVYKDEIKQPGHSFILSPLEDATKVKISIDQSALDTTSVYKIQANIVDDMGQAIEEIGSFELQNK